MLLNIEILALKHHNTIGKKIEDSFDQRFDENGNFIPLEEIEVEYEEVLPLNDNIQNLGVVYFYKGEEE